MGRFAVGLIGARREAFTPSTKLAALGYGRSNPVGGALVLDADVVFP